MDIVIYMFKKSVVTGKMETEVVRMVRLEEYR